MSESAELTTRDVFAQIDRRLTRLEDDLRELRRYVEDRFAALEAKLTGRLDSSEARTDTRFAALEAKVDRNFRWLLGITLAAWLSIMTTLLLK